VAIRVKMSISLRDERGVIFGSLKKVSDRQLDVVCESAYMRGQLLEFQFELEGFRVSVYGKARVEGVNTPELGPSRYVLRIVEQESSQAAQYREWLYELAQGGGSSSRPHEHLSSIISNTARARPERMAEGERRLRAMDERRTRSSATSTSSSWLSSSVSGARRGVGRTALREALRSYTTEQDELEAWSREQDERAPERRRPSARPRRARVRGEQRSVASSDVGRSERSSSVSSVRPTRERRSSQNQGSAPKRKRRRVDVKVAANANPPIVNVRFNDPKRYQRQYREYLRRDALYVRIEHSGLALDTAVQVRLVIPGGHALIADGRVVADMPTGLGVALVLDDEQRHLLRLAAGRWRRNRGIEMAV